MRRWVNGLPTEYQMTLVFGLFMLLVFYTSPLSPVLDKNLGNILIALGTLAGGSFLHGMAARSKFSNPDAIKDILGDPPEAPK